MPINLGSPIHQSLLSLDTQAAINQHLQANGGRALGMGEFELIDTAIKNAKPLLGHALAFLDGDRALAVGSFKSMMNELHASMGLRTQMKEKGLTLSDFESIFKGTPSHQALDEKYHTQLDELEHRLSNGSLNSLEKQFAKICLFTAYQHESVQIAQGERAHLG
ncbi:hypothetical protein [Noviherbaspirillum galbum]|uniref:Uncharacterized protein n=1 Tax=Noviherbaspirillum galbum TaxID=2709383 RepID=A0A6B3SK38_9BURK|nr:hypothetical protein [Noviherbaspirillum galbum]NEX60918.1 hypothetical protein [Noviherbaspirillum galbum]